jgi:hypothetical protein
MPDDMETRGRRLLMVALTIALVGAAVVGCTHGKRGATEHQDVRLELFTALAPSKLTNCTLKRYGDSHDGGYLMCENLMDDAEVAYSYGIEGRDQWVCDLSCQLGTTIHQYDCFNLTRPLCDRGTFQFHEECIGDRASVVDRRPFDTLSSHIVRNGDAGKHLILKMDVEGAEWDSLLTTPDSVLDVIDQLVIEFHGTDAESFVQTVDKLKPREQLYV